MSDPQARTARSPRRGRAEPSSRRRPVRMASVAAAFSLFALYLAWHAATQDTAMADEVPLASAQAQASKGAFAPASAVSGAVRRVGQPAPHPASDQTGAPISSGALAGSGAGISTPAAASGELPVPASPSASSATFGSAAASAAEVPAPSAGPDEPGEAAAGTMLVQSEANSTDLVKRGAYLARAGDCIACHTADKSQPFAGGLPIGTPFGIIYTPNITPDPDTGIGRWTDADFIRAMHEGVGKGGEHLYPAFPYTEYTRVAERDLLAVRAYLNTLAPIHYTPPRNELRFPFNQRWLLFFWKLFNFEEGRFVPDPKRSPQWNRGAYLVQGLAHCGECHTPRNLMQGLKTTSQFSGGEQAGWRAFNITPDKAGGIGGWSDDDLVHYLATGVAAGRANAAGPMADVVANSTQFLNAEDLRSINVYLRSLPPVSGGQTHPRDAWGKPADDVLRLRGATVKGIDGAQLFVANCASCHGWTGQGAGGTAPLAYPSLIRNSAVGAPDAGNLAMVVLHGVARRTKDADVMMPAFGNELDDEQIAAIVNYVTQRFGNPHATLTAADIAKLRTRPQ